MDISNLTALQHYSDFFRQSLVEDVAYWQQYLKDPAADNARLKRKREQIIRHIQFALDLETTWQPVQALIQAFSPYMERWGYWYQWQEVLEDALSVAHHFEDKPGQIKLYILLARLAYQQGHFSETIANYYQAIRLAHQVGDLENRARAYSNLGFLYTELGNWWRAEILGCAALRIFAALKYDHGLAHTENHLGYLYTWQRLWDKAKHHLERAYAIWEAMKDPHGLMRASINLSALYIEMETPDEAIQPLEKALHQAGLAGEEIELGAIYENMGLAYRLKGEITTAENYLWQAEAIFRRSGDMVKQARLWKNLARVYLDQGKRPEAASFLETALAACRTANNKNEEFRILLDVVENELTGGNGQTAAAHLNTLETLISQHSRGEQHHYLKQRLTKYRRSLPGLHS